MGSGRSLTDLALPLLPTNPTCDKPTIAHLESTSVRGHQRSHSHSHSHQIHSLLQILPDDQCLLSDGSDDAAFDNESALFPEVLLNSHAEVQFHLGLTCWLPMPMLTLHLVGCLAESLGLINLPFVPNPARISRASNFLALPFSLNRSTCKMDHLQIKSLQTLSFA